ncbi:MAG: ComEA family DNA-binding protein [Agriterribacter sp.]
MKLAATIACLCFTVWLHAQQLPTSAMEQQLEDYTERMDDAETSDDTWMQQIEFYKRSPLNLNTATEDDLRNLQMLNALQIEHFINYRRLLGKLISIYELQAVPSWDIATILKIRLYVTVSNTSTPIQQLKYDFRKGDYSFITRYGRTIEKAKGYQPADSGASFYAGSPARIMLRFKYNYKNQLQYGITAAKDAGEPFFNQGNRAGFDFYSFHLFSKQAGLIKTIALGDYTVNMGQGLICWQGLAFGKGAGIANIKRQSATLRPYNSAGSFFFNRGAAVSLQKNNWESNLFISLRRLDGNLARDTAFSENISSIQLSGYHRTPSELEDKSAFRLFSYGGNISYRKKSWRAGFNIIQYHFSKPIQKETQPYNLYAIQGNYWSNYSVNYQYTYKNIHFFGETAVDKNLHAGAVHGLLASLHARTDFVLFHRYISPTYQAFYGNAFTVNSNPTNEQGLYTGAMFRLSPAIKLDAYIDLFQFPWLKYRVDAPAIGKDYFVQMTYKPGKLTEIYSRYREQQKPVNQNNAQSALNTVTAFSNRSWRTQVNHQLSSTVSIRQRFELLWYTQETTSPEKGFLLFFDVFYKPMQSRFAANARLQYFESDSYNSRLYAYENDVLYYFAIPVFYDKGSRYYLNIHYKINKKLAVWCKWAQTIYNNRTSIGSGLDEIAGNRKSELRLLLSAHL